MVRLPSGARYWTVVNDDLVVVPDADAYLRHLRFGRDAAELTTKSYAGAIALFLRWCDRTGRHWHAGVEHLGLFMTWLVHAVPAVTGPEAGGELGEVMVGPGARPVRGARRVNVVLTAVRGFVAHAVSSGNAPAGLMPLLYELADERELPEAARREDGRIPWRLRARHRRHEPDDVVDRASDEDIVALLHACRSARDRLIVLLMARAGLRRGELCGLRLLDSEHARRALGEVAVPFGVCTEPSNVRAGGGACPFRFRCAGCDHFRTDVSYLPDLQAYLDDLLRNRERLLACSELDEWARGEAMPSEDEIGRIRGLIVRVKAGIEDLTADERAGVEEAVEVVRRHRAVALGMPQVRRVPVDLRPDR